MGVRGAKSGLEGGSGLAATCCRPVFGVWSAISFHAKRHLAEVTGRPAAKTDLGSLRLGIFQVLISSRPATGTEPGPLSSGDSGRWPELQTLRLWSLWLRKRKILLARFFTSIFRSLPEPSTVKDPGSRAIAIADSLRGVTVTIMCFFWAVVSPLPSQPVTPHPIPRSAKNFEHSICGWGWVS